MKFANCRTIVGLAGLLALQSWGAAGPRVTVVGDSYSTYAGAIPDVYATYYTGSNCGVTDVSMTWWSKVIAGLGGTLEVNNSWSGSFVTTFDIGNGSKPMIDDSRLSDEALGAPDVILVCGGTNDSWSNVPIGDDGGDPFDPASWTAENLGKFRYAFAYLVARLKDRRPTAEIVIVANSTDDCGANESRPGIKLAIRSAMAETAAHFGAVFAPLSGISKTDEHPNAEGMATMASEVLSAYEEAHLETSGEPFGEFAAYATTDDPTARAVRTADGIAFVFTNASRQVSLVAATNLQVVGALVVGGGGAGGTTIGGGGGGGGVVEHKLSLAFSVSDRISVSVGAGGLPDGAEGRAQQPDGWNRRGGNGESSSVDLAGRRIVAAGGGGGGSWDAPVGADGANGGGSGGYFRDAAVNPGGCGYAGFNGGGCTKGGGPADFCAGGGGGAQGAGGTGSAQSLCSGDGGSGLERAISGESVVYGSGGGGGSGNNVQPGAGGTNAGDGNQRASGQYVGNPGRDGTGGGGGGGGYDGVLGYPGGAGGCGTVILLTRVRVPGEEEDDPGSESGETGLAAQIISSPDIPVHTVFTMDGIALIFTNVVAAATVDVLTGIRVKKILVVGGGGAGGGMVGGGGGGGSVKMQDVDMSIPQGGQFSVSVGAGGQPFGSATGLTEAEMTQNGGNGGDSQFCCGSVTVTANGGGGGAKWGKTGSDGGNGGGSAGWFDTGMDKPGAHNPGGRGWSGFNGGASCGAGTGNSEFFAGGGGGAAAAGGDGNHLSKLSGAGGEGVTHAITGEYVVYGSGGGGGAGNTALPQNGGTNGGAGNDIQSGEFVGHDGLDGTGSGGGGGGFDSSSKLAYPGGGGGSGIVVVLLDVGDLDVFSLSKVSVVEKTKTTASCNVRLLLPDDLTTADLKAIYSHDQFTYEREIAKSAGEPGLYSFDLTCLKPGATYVCRVVAKSSGGESAEGAPVKFTLAAETYRQRQLPAGMESVEYVDANGTSQYIDTGYWHVPETSVEAVFMDNGPQENAWHALFGSRNNNFWNDMACCLVFFISTTEGWPCMSTTGEEAKGDSGTPLPYQRKVRVTTQLNTAMLYDGDGEPLWTHRLGGNGAMQKAMGSLFLMAYNESEGNSDGKVPKGYSNVRIYSFKIFEDGLPVRNFVPAKDSEGLACLYETVRGTCHYSNLDDRSKLVAGPTIPTALPITETSVRYQGRHVSATFARTDSEEREVFVVFGASFGDADVGAWETRRKVGAFKAGETQREFSSGTLPRNANYVRFVTADGAWSRVYFLPEMPKAQGFMLMVR